MQLLRLALLFVGLPLTYAFAAQVQKIDAANQIIWLNDIAGSEWKVSDGLCLFQENRSLACGTIQAITAKQMAVQLNPDSRDAAIATNSYVSLKRFSRSVANTAQAAQQLEISHRENRADLGIGLTTGFNYFYPTLHFQLALSRQFSLGIEPTFVKYSQDSRSITFYGASLLASYFHTHYAFKGVHFTGGLGLFNITAKTDTIAEQTASPLAAKFVVGWRGRALMGIPLDFGAAIGAQYVFQDTAPLNTNFKRLLPVLQVSASYPL